MNYLQLHEHNIEQFLFGRYITLQHIEPLLQRYNPEVAGKSVLAKPIYRLKIGTGKIKILIWSQMHGNESTTTKAVFDFINFLHSQTTASEFILKKFTFCLIPMLNPDGSEAYTRENANGIDLNRDAQNLSQPESVILRKTFEEFKPNYCYNLHDQRTIFGIDDTGKPATVSFLAPAFNESRDINTTRIQAINVIVAMNNVLQKFIPSQIGRFDDSFNINCVGDTFQSLGVPTVLFEAGHFPNDYEREETRKYIFVALLSGIEFLCENDIVINKTNDYLNIPQNKVIFFDFIYKNVKINYDNREKIINFAAQYKEVVLNGTVNFEARIAQIESVDNFFGHIVLDANSEMFSSDESSFPQIDQKADFYLGKSNRIVNGLLNN